MKTEDIMFKGVNSPVVTIMKDDGSIDYANMERHINHLVEAGWTGCSFSAVWGSFMRSVMLKNEH